MASIHIRPAGLSDAPAVRDIYAPYVENTAITFEVDVPGAADFEERIRSTLAAYPFLVAEEEGGRILGYAYAARQMERAAYQWNATLSVYLGDFKGRGLGTVLYTALMNILKLQNIHNVYGGVTWPNPASEALHIKLGFSLLGRYRRTGFKDGKWHDVIWFEKRLLDEDNKIGGSISPPALYRDLEADRLAACLGIFDLGI